MTDAQTRTHVHRDTNPIQFEAELKELEADLNKFKSNKEEEQELKILFTRNLKLSHQFNSLVNSSTHQKDGDELSFVSNYDQKRLLNKLKQLETEILELQTQSSSSTNEPSLEAKATRFKFKKAVQRPSESLTIPETRSSATTIPTIPTVGPSNSATEQPFGLDSSSQFIFCRPSQPLQPLQSLSLSDLSNLVLDLRPLAPHLSSLFLSRIHHLALLAPPLSGSCSLNHVSHSLLCLVSQQLRTYQCNDLFLLIYTATNPVIENSTRIKISSFPEKKIPLNNYTTTTTSWKNSQHHLPKDFDFPSISISSSSSSGLSPNVSILSNNSPFSDDDFFNLFLNYQDLHVNSDDTNAVDFNSMLCANLSDEAKAVLKKL